ncbi:hypothetical protein CTAYLR_003798 [Chrysophaeum taylorii]|uniref:Ubiquitin-like domain-containing protein n=1 Tax=Chrysophaeum taylorii TaxID=2483200 RepID=A0AAD7UF17_9STRA|nr:hypothetical protein CTAYLR_003798 [Chrysophaeum taylorii]
MIIVRVRHAAGTWRVKVKAAGATAREVQEAIFAAHKVPVEQQTLSSDPGGKEVLREGGDLGLKNGDMVYLKTEATLSEGSGVRRKIGADGTIQAQRYDDYTSRKGFRPGMSALGDMKKSWTLTDFLAMDDQFIFKIKRQEEATCASVTLDTSSCISFQSYASQLGWRQTRSGFLYGTFEEDNTVRVECLYEAPSFDAEPEEGVEEMARLFGLRKVGWIFAHPPREKGFVFSGQEAIHAATLQLDAADGVNETPFVSVKVTVNENGEANFEAYQVSSQCMAMVAEGALGVRDDDLASCAVHPTFTAVVEGKQADKVDTNFFLCNVPVKQHASTIFTAGATFPKENRAVLQTRDDLKPLLKKPRLLKDVLADFGLLLFLSKFPQIFDRHAFFPALAAKINDNEDDLDDGYKLILFSFAGIDDF